jgi:hypothetical protein
MMQVPILWLICFALSSLSAATQNSSTTFVGEAVEGRTFRKSVGHGLDFVLMPDSIGGGITGWALEVSPQGTPSDPDCGDFLWVVTPPYHFQNERYLDTAYGMTAQKAVRYSPRGFSFVLNCGDFKTERKRVELVMYGSHASGQEVDDARTKLGASPLGKGRLWIIDSKITPGHDSATAQDVGSIHWIKFKVEIKFPAALPLHPKP